MTTASKRDMWDWFALLDACCDVKISSARRDDGHGGHTTVWTAVVSHRAASDTPVQSEACSMLDAMVAALEEAQERRWIR